MIVQLPRELEEYISEKIAGGGYLSSLDVIDAGIRLLREKDDTASRRLHELRQDLDRGITEADRGELIDGAEFMAELSRRHEKRLQSVS